MELPKLDRRMIGSLTDFTLMAGLDWIKPTDLLLIRRSVRCSIVVVGSSERPLACKYGPNISGQIVSGFPGRLLLSPGGIGQIRHLCYSLTIFNGLK